ncbi:hypothetical protein VP01_5418g1, partial [Puccinia sorghi]
MRKQTYKRKKYSTKIFWQQSKDFPKFLMRKSSNGCSKRFTVMNLALELGIYKIRKKHNAYVLLQGVLLMGLKILVESKYTGYMIIYLWVKKRKRRRSDQVNSKQELKDLNINITSNHLMGILLHIETKYAVKQELSQHIKHHVFQDPLHSAWTFENILKILTLSLNPIDLSPLHHKIQNMCSIRKKNEATLYDSKSRYQIENSQARLDSYVSDILCFLYNTLITKKNLINCM